MIKFPEATIFDRLDWYEKPEIYEQAKERFAVLMRWLLTHDMLNADGKAIAERGIQDDFLLYDGVLTDEGTAFLEKHYEKWLFSEGMSDPITTDMLDAAVKDRK